ncbi:MAG: tRNA pseudouridine(55) synthase TruB [Anaerolineae bacterium]
MRDGFLIIDKPRGVTSHDVVQRVRRVAHTRQVGHAGTLDPLATGVLIVCVGQATRLSEYLLGHDKAYRATMCLGVETDTYDADGQITATRAVNVDRTTLAAALQQFVGNIQQVPPMHSAIKQHGQKLYELARAGVEVDRPARPVTIHSIEVVDFNAPQVVIDVRCSAGTYIRSLAHDVGEVLGTGAHLTALSRTASGPFTIAEATPLERLEAAANADEWTTFLRSIDAALSDWPSVVLDERQQQRAITGGRIEALQLNAERCRAYDAHGNLIALLVFDQKKHWWRAEKVLTINTEH